MWRGWNMLPKTALTLCCLLLFAASVFPRSDAEVEEKVVGGEANVITSSDEDASHAVVYDAANFRSEIDRRRMHFVMLFKARFVIKTSTRYVRRFACRHVAWTIIQANSQCASVSNCLAVCMLFKVC